jgi:NAD(P)-dependent dehydrogenase (short-subunit alcohol dehydrogenase family)
MAKKIILITGANRGIGKEMALQLAKLGHTVWIGARNFDSAKETAQEIGNMSLPIQLDVLNTNSIEKAVAHIEEKNGSLDVLINNAAIMDTAEGISQTPIEVIRGVMETNYFGVLQVTQAFIPLLSKSVEGGRIINMSSEMGLWSNLDGRYAGYRLSKVGLNSITVMLAEELKAQNITVNSVCPGWTQTEMGGKHAPRTVAQGADIAVWLAHEPQIPTGKFFKDRQESNFF